MRIETYEMQHAARSSEESAIRETFSAWSQAAGARLPALELYMRLRPANGRPYQRLDFSDYLDGLYGYAMVLARNSAEAEDLVQE